MLQGTTPTPSISIGQLLGLVVAVLSIITMIGSLIVFAYKLGGMNQQIKAAGEGWAKALEEIKQSVGTVQRDLADWTAWRMEWTSWRSQITEQVDTIQKIVDRRHHDVPGSPHRREGDSS